MGRTARLFRLRNSGALILIFITAASMLAAPAFPAVGGARSSVRAAVAEDRPVHIVVLVDESGSLGSDAIEAERVAASRIGQSALWPMTSVAVLGFASGGTAGRSSVDRVCPLTATDDRLGRQRISECVRKLRARTANEGYDTDFVEAFRAAKDAFRTAETDAHRILFLLTDGQLDVGDNPIYGDGSREERNERARRILIDEVLPELARDGVQIWPLGFGREIDEQELRAYAAAGFQGSCNADGVRPKHFVVPDSAQVQKAVDGAYEAALCQRSGPSDEGDVEPGSAVDLHVQVPPIATAGSIQVIKNDPRIRVEYYAPNGDRVPESGTRDGASFQVSGQNGPVEALRVTNPVPGEWRIRLTAPEGVRRQKVSGRVVWQGRLDSLIALDQPAPAPGTQITVRLRLRTTSGITAPEVLDGITFTAEATGSWPSPIPVPLNDRGEDPDEKAGDGRFSGRFIVPADATGPFTVTGRVGGPGLIGDSVPYEGVVSAEPPPVTGLFTFEWGEATPGAAISGTLLLRNDSETPKRLRLRLADVPDQAETAIRPAVVEVPAATTRTFEIALTFGDRASLGSVSGRVQALNDSDGTPVAEDIFAAVIGPPPTVFDRYRWTFAALLAALLAIAAAVALLRRQVTARRDPRGLVACLYQDGTEVFRLPCKGARTDAFRFAIRGVEGTPRLDRAVNGVDAYAARRGERGEIVLRTPEGDTLRLRPGHREDVGDRLSLAIEDPRVRPGPASAPAPPQGPGPRPWDGGDPLLD